MVLKISVLAGYFLILIIIGFIARTRWSASPETYFLADRKLGPLLLLGTMVATNFSAFTVFGTSGAGYRDGYAFFPIMGFGTGFMALTFWIIGRRAWQVGKDRQIVTPPELVRYLYASPGLSMLFAWVMIIFTIPYLALQPMAAGYALEALIGLPYQYGCILITAVIVLYTLRGGMRAVAWTDLFQGLLMFGLLLAALIMIINHHGGLAQANQKVFAVFPELFSRPGGQGKYTVGIWLSYMALWFFCDPMFPQLFQRFFSAKSRRTLGTIMLFYPLVCTVVFFMPIAIGVLGKLSFPDLVGKQADRILPLVLNHISGDVMAALVIAAGLAALMSTMDSQLLTLSSIFTRDVMPQKHASARVGRLFVVVLSLAGLAMAYHPPATILQIATQTFTGLAVLFPTVLFGLYWKRVFAPAAIASIVAGEALVFAFYMKWLVAGPVLPVVWVMMAVFGAFLAVHAAMAMQRNQLSWHVPDWIRNPYVYGFAILFALATDFWAWRRVGPEVWGVPIWLGYFVLLSAIQTVMMRQLVRSQA